MMCPAIAYKRKSFLKKFSKLENWEWFHQVVHRLFEAPTIPITRLIQQKIVSDLEARGEGKAAKWFLETWTGEYGNYTNGTAGYVGNNKSAGIESHWRYMRRDTIGSAGSNIRLSIAVFVPNLLKYISDLSEKHAAKVLNPNTGRHSFPSCPVITPKIWNKVHKFDTTRLALCSIEASAEVKATWNREIQYFIPKDSQPLGIIDLMTSFHAIGKLAVTRRQVGSIIMPSEKLLAHTRRASNLIDRTTANLETLRQIITPLQDVYLDLFNGTEEWNLKYPTKTTTDILDIMESFER